MRTTRAIYFIEKKRRIISVMRVAFTERVNQFQAGMHVPVFCRLISRFLGITALDHEEADDIDRRNHVTTTDEIMEMNARLGMGRP